MYLTAQRVLSTVTRARGVNVFVYLHGSYVWDPGVEPTRFLPEVNPGELAQRWVDLEPGGNRVLSYLDVVVPDETPREELYQRLLALKHVVREQGNPAVAIWDAMWVRFGTGVPVPWTTELGALSGHLVLRLTGRER